jgi:hypothetical protein
VDIRTRGSHEPLCYKRVKSYRGGITLLLVVDVTLISLWCMIALHSSIGL